MEEPDTVDLFIPDVPAEELAVYEPLDCSSLTFDDWEPEEFDFVLYRYFACNRDEGENILFSPAAFHLAP